MKSVYLSSALDVARVSRTRKPTAAFAARFSDVGLRVANTTCGENEILSLFKNSSLLGLQRPQDGRNQL